jgi:nucleoside-diphosphate-sugar epimerase
MSVTAVIFGGCGFLGTHLARALEENAEYGRIVLADMHKPRELGPKSCYVACDVCAPIDIAVAGEVEVYNFAAVHRTPGHDDWEYFWTNCLGAINICRFASRVGALRMVFASSQGVYGPQEQPVDEGVPPAPVTAYGKSKLVAESIHEMWQGESPERRRLIVVRPAVTFGEGEHGHFALLARTLRRRRFVYPGRKTTIKACAPVEELARSIAFMSRFDEPVIRYVYAYPERTTTEYIARAFHDAAGYGEPKWVAPQWLMLALAGCFEAAAKLGIRTPISRARVRKLIQSTNVYPSELVQRGWAFQFDLTEALRRWRDASNFE